MFTAVGRDIPEHSTRLENVIAYLDNLDAGTPLASKLTDCVDFYRVSPDMLKRAARCERMPPRGLIAALSARIEQLEQSVAGKESALAKKDADHKAALEQMELAKHEAKRLTSQFTSATFNVSMGQCVEVVHIYKDQGQERRSWKKGFVTAIRADAIDVTVEVGHVFMLHGAGFDTRTVTNPDHIRPARY